MREQAKIASTSGEGGPAVASSGVSLGLRLLSIGPLLILIVLVLIFYAGPQIFGPGTSPRSLIDSLSTAVLV